MGGISFPPKKLITNPCVQYPVLLNSFALLVSYCAGCLASRLAGRLAVATAALSSSRLEICLVDSCDVLQKEHLFLGK